MASYNYKTILIGDPGVGKSSLVSRYIDNKKPGPYDLTIGVDYTAKILTVFDTENNETKVKLQIWDTAGQEAFKSITSTYYKTTIGVIVVFDLTSYESYEHINQWINDVKEVAPKNITIILIGNKLDLTHERQVSKKEVEEYAKKHDIDYIETSAMSGHLVEHIFKKLAQDIYNKYPDSYFKNKDNLEIVGIKSNKTNTGNSKVDFDSKSNNRLRSCSC